MTENHHRITVESNSTYPASFADIHLAASSTDDPFEAFPDLRDQFLDGLLDEAACEAFLGTYRDACLAAAGSVPEENSRYQEFQIVEGPLRMLQASTATDIEDACVRFYTMVGHGKPAARTQVLKNALRIAARWNIDVDPHLIQRLRGITLATCPNGGVKIVVTPEERLVASLLDRAPEKTVMPSDQMAGIQALESLSQMRSLPPMPDALAARLRAGRDEHHARTGE